VRTWLRVGSDWIAGLGVRESDSAAARIRMEGLTLAAAAIAVAASGWVAAYAALGLWLSAAIPFAYQVGTVISLALLRRSGRVQPVVQVLLAMWLLLPFLLQWSLGGFVESSAVALWGLGAPFGAIVFQGARESVRWFVGFLVLLGISGLVDGSLGTDPDLPAALSIAFFVLNIAGIAVTAFVLMLYFVRARERAHAALALERERSERLLLNVLPETIAERLKDVDGVIADRHADVSVLFADLVGFTPAAESLEPERVVGLLDEIFSLFDDLVASHGLEKIKTIGDGYMAAGGIPEPRPDHARAVAELALAMQAALAGRESDVGLSLRIGIDSGPVVAGVIGRSRFGYDLWGDTVNTASRMESHAPPGSIQITERTFELLGDGYRFEQREGIDVKGKGPMTTYLLLGRAEAPATVTP
jgi:adenylate cyclase